LLILLLFAFSIPIVYASREEIDRANIGLKATQQLRAWKPMYIDGEIHQVKNKKGQIRRVVARRAIENGR
jgi:hypothetical protein